MKIAWSTPYNPRSAIGDYGHAIVGALRASGTEAVVYAAEPDVDPRPSDLPVVRVPSEPDDGFLATLDRFDALVYNFGDYLPYHPTIYHVALRRPRAVVL